MTVFNNAVVYRQYEKYSTNLKLKQAMACSFVHLHFSKLCGEIRKRCKKKKLRILFWKRIIKEQNASSTEFSKTMELKNGILNITDKPKPIILNSSGPSSMSIDLILASKPLPSNLFQSENICEVIFDEILALIK